MESRILLLGPVGAGKTTAIRAISDIEAVDTDVRPSDDVALLKSTTTVAMDLGVVRLDEQDRIVLYGAPGQERFDFMWEILLDQCEGVLLLVDHSAADPVADLARYYDLLMRPGQKRRPLLVGVTHFDDASDRNLARYDAVFKRARTACGCLSCTPPVQALDARASEDVRALLIALAAMLEVQQRFRNRTCLS
ncbi:GTP-binding protein [Roseateles sp. MS654]|uniref:GTP-binding protein n=1 Tax=Roseateles sp. MS654 TaxID=3412685 RepID=UPI003C2D65AA